jgi:hypothetical protein
MTNILTYYGHLFVEKTHQGRQRVHFVNDDLHFNQDHEAPFLYLSTVLQTFLPKLEMAVKVFEENQQRRYVSRTLYTAILYNSEETKRIQLKLQLAVLAVEGQLQIRLQQFRRLRITQEGQSVMSKWQPTYGSFRFNPEDLATLKHELGMMYANAQASPLVSSFKEMCL